MPAGVSIPVTTMAQACNLSGDPSCATPIFEQDVTGLASYSVPSEEVTIAAFGTLGRNVLTTAGDSAGKSVSASVSVEQFLDDDDTDLVTQALPVSINTATLSTVTLSPLLARIISGTTLDFTATGTFSDSSTLDMSRNVLWTTDPEDTEIAAVSNFLGTQGQVVAPEDATGSLKIQAQRNTDDDEDLEVVAETTLTTGAILDDPDAGDPDGSLSITGPGSVNVGKVISLVATGNLVPDGDANTLDTQTITRHVVWSSSNESVAVVSNGTGLQGQVTGVSPGSVTITARYQSLSQTFVVTVN
jgi:hypothetical protein